jgi:murein DD-endopeptidase MepM/ murein hydrolase activator NlpD
VALLGELLGPQAAADAYQLLGPQSPDAVAASGADASGVTASPSRPTARAGVGVVPSGGEAVTVEQMAAQKALADADAGRRPGAALGPVPSIPVGPIPAPGQLSSPAAGSPGAGVGLPVATELGPLVCPVAGPNYFTATFGVPRSQGRTHQGTDLIADAGLPLVAVGPAVVVHINTIDRQDSLGGITVSYTTSNGDRWYNAHLSRLAPGMRVGQYLTAGQTFGYVGQSGDARKSVPHLHIERHPGGARQAVDAYPALKRACG